MTWALAVQMLRGVTIFLLLLIATAQLRRWTEDGPFHFLFWIAWISLVIWALIRLHRFGERMKSSQISREPGPTARSTD